jgi:hypothetical protein
MWQYALKVTLTVMLVIAVAEIGKRSSFWGAVVASLPLVSLLAFVWLYVETGNKEGIAALSSNIFWLVLASLPLFLALPALLRSGWPFWPSLAVACAATIAVYVVLVWVLERYGMRW